ncbi:MAG TPA: hypothetical protein VFB02_14880 [Bradyrhizobium sp.]|nr:hypothetical protein [Bradyrhizobium sp.]
MLHRSLGEERWPRRPTQRLAIETRALIRRAASAVQHGPRRAKDRLADDGAGDGGSGDRVRAAGKVVSRLERRPGTNVEPSEIRDIGRKRVARNADYEDRLLMRYDPGSRNNAFRCDCRDDVERSPGIADGAGYIEGGERIAEDMAV